MELYKQIGEALVFLRPGAEWALRGETYEGLEWLDKNQTKPSLEEITNYIKTYEYVEKRKKEYPSLEDQLDAIWKGEPYTLKMKDKILAIKQKYPKSEGI